MTRLCPPFRGYGCTILYHVNQVFLEQRGEQKLGPIIITTVEGTYPELNYGPLVLSLIIIVL